MKVILSLSLVTIVAMMGCVSPIQYMIDQDFAKACPNDCIEYVVLEQEEEKISMSCDAPVMTTAPVVVTPVPTVVPVFNEEETDNNSEENSVSYFGIILTSEERTLLTQAVMAEAGSSVEPQENRIAVAQVILNRILDGYWGNSLRSVLSASGQFSSWPRLQYCTPTEDCYKAVDDVLAGENLLLDTDVLYFSTSNWGFTEVVRYGGHIFGK